MHTKRECGTARPADLIMPHRRLLGALLCCSAALAGHVPNADVNPQAPADSCGSGPVEAGESNLQYSRGTWPWHAILLTDQSSWYRCSGTLVTKTHVITSKSCTYSFSADGMRDEKPLVPGDFTVLLGVHDIMTDLSRMTTETMHQWKVATITRQIEESSVWSGNLAVLTIFNTFVVHLDTPPACALPAFNTSMHNKELWEVGWGTRRLAPLRRERFPTQWRLSPINNNKTCADRVLDSDQFCAGDESGLGACMSGDTGGGLFVQEKVGYVSSSTEDRPIWSLVGVFSHMISNGSTCEPFGVFTEVAKHRSWLEYILFGGCEVLRDDENLRVHYTDTWRYDHVEYTCRNSSMTLRGDSSLSCIDDEWNGTKPTCVDLH